MRKGGASEAKSLFTDGICFKLRGLAGSPVVKEIEFQKVLEINSKWAPWGQTFEMLFGGVRQVSALAFRVATFAQEFYLHQRNCVRTNSIADFLAGLLRGGLLAWLYRLRFMW